MGIFSVAQHKDMNHGAVYSHYRRKISLDDITIEDAHIIQY